MEFPQDLRYHPEDTWARVESDGRVRVGITDYAQDQLGDIVWVDLPEPGDPVTFGQAFGAIESNKSVADLHAPASGTVAEVNSDLEQEPELVNREPYGRGWIVLVDASEPSAEQLLDAAAYRESLERR